MELDQHIEAVLFYKAEPIKKATLARFFSTDPEHLEEGLQKLEERLSSGAIRLLRTDNEVQLVTAPELADLVELLRKDELKRDIGKAGAETLAIIAYRGPVSRAEIDKVRGVNSAFILRNLLVRGLIERRDNPRDQRSYVYAATPQLFAHLGIENREGLPQFSEIMNELDTFEKQLAEEETT